MNAAGKFTTSSEMWLVINPICKCHQIFRVQVLLVLMIHSEKPQVQNLQVRPCLLEHKTSEEVAQGRDRQTRETAIRRLWPQPLCLRLIVTSEGRQQADTLQKPYSGNISLPLSLGQVCSGISLAFFSVSRFPCLFVFLSHPLLFLCT